MKVAVRYARHAGLAALFVAAALLGTLSGVLFAYSDDLPEVSALDSYSPNTITRVLGKNGQVVGEFAVERRVVIHYTDIPDNLRQAILAAEDAGFFEHSGFSISRMFLALMRDVVTRGRSPGGSTITQQLTRNLFPQEIGFAIGNRSRHPTCLVERNVNAVLADTMADATALFHGRFGEITLDNIAPSRSVSPLVHADAG